jgi:hypothetical protein
MIHIVGCCADDSLVTEEILGRNEDNQVVAFGLHNALASQPRIDARIDGAVDKIFLLIGDFGQLVFALKHIHVACAAPANTAAVMLKVNIVVEGHVQHRLALGRYVRLRGLAILKLEGDVNGVHKIGSWGAI